MRTPQRGGGGRRKIYFYLPHPRRAMQLARLRTGPRRHLGSGCRPARAMAPHQEQAPALRARAQLCVCAGRADVEGEDEEEASVATPRPPLWTRKMPTAHTAVRLIGSRRHITLARHTIPLHFCPLSRRRRPSRCLPCSPLDASAAAKARIRGVSGTQGRGTWRTQLVTLILTQLVRRCDRRWRCCGHRKMHHILFQFHHILFQFHHHTQDDFGASGII